MADTWKGLRFTVSFPDETMATALAEYAKAHRWTTAFATRVIVEEFFTKNETVGEYAIRVTTPEEKS